MELTSQLIEGMGTLCPQPRGIYLNKRNMLMLKYEAEDKLGHSFPDEDKQSRFEFMGVPLMILGCIPDNEIRLVSRDHMVRIINVG